MPNLPVTTRFLFARHGQTTESLQGAFCGVTEALLTPIGHLQAQRLAKRLRQEYIDALYCSPQQRALDTAEPIAAMLGLEIQQRHALREMDFRQWEGHYEAILAQEYPEALALWERGSWMACPPGGETQNEYSWIRRNLCICPNCVSKLHVTPKRCTTANSCMPLKGT